MMILPPETSTALFPKSVKAGNVTLFPLTVGGVVSLSDIGVEIGRRVPKDKLFQVAHVLSVGSSVPLDRFLRKARVGLKELSTAVEKVLNDAFSTYLKPQPENKRVPGPPTGLGWPLEIVEFLCSTYGWTAEQALDCPLSTAFAFMAAFRQRHGERHGEPDYVEKIAIDEWKRQKTLKSPSSTSTSNINLTHG